jgi:outer membrane protein assembly complex protein YaeT
MRLRGSLRGVLLAALVGMAGLGAACHENDVKVASLSLSGNEALTTAEIEAVLATKSSGWLPWSPHEYFDREEFEADLGRIRRLYQDRGFPNARVTGVDVALNEKGDAVDLSITIDEGTPVLVEDVRFAGFEVLDEPLRATLESAPLTAGSPRDRAALAATRQHGIDLLRDHGFAHGDVTITETDGASPSSVIVTFGATPGPPTVFGPITYVGLSTLSERVVSRQLSFRTGQPYRQNLVNLSQRRLGSLAIVQFVNIDARPPEGSLVSAIPVTVTLTENPPRRLELGVGYGSEDRLRGSASWSHLNFLGNARQVTTAAKWSSIERGFRASLNQPYLYLRGLSLDASGTTWWTSEPMYVSRTYGGRIGVSYRLGRRGPGTSRVPLNVFRTAYIHEYLSYGVREEALTDLDTVDERIALGLDPITGQGRGTKAAVSFEYERNATDTVLNPSRGYGVALRTELARPGLGGTFRYGEYVAEARGYVPVGAVVVASRARYGALRAENDASVPFSERFFLGGSTSLRGWGRYQVAPLIDGLPVGGRAMLDLSAEIRMPLGGRLGAVGFFDAGNVWADHGSARFGDLKQDAGFGLRYGTPIGQIRGDVAFQLTRIPGLLINGEPETRHWRVHFSIGQAF